MGSYSFKLKTFCFLLAQYLGVKCLYTSWQRGSNTNDFNNILRNVFLRQQITNATKLTKKILYILKLRGGGLDIQLPDGNFINGCNKSIPSINVMAAFRKPCLSFFWHSKYTFMLSRKSQTPKT